jgi:hypothetical protein
MKNMNRGGGFNSRLMAALAVSAALFVPLAVFGAPALARSASAASQYQYSGSSQYQYKVAVCHHTHSASHPWVQINVASAGWLHGHSKHRGDFLVTSAFPCPPTTPPGSIVAPRGHGHGNKSGHGKDTHGSSGATQGSSNHGKGNDAHGSSSATQGSNNSATTQGTNSATQGSSDAHGNGNGANGNDHGNGNGNGNSGNGNGHHH